MAEHALDFAESLAVRVVKFFDAHLSTRVSGGVIILLALFSVGFTAYIQISVGPTGKQITNVHLPASPVDVRADTICANAQTIEYFDGLVGRTYSARWDDNGSLGRVRWDRDEAPTVFSVSINDQTASVPVDDATLKCLQTNAKPAKGSLTKD